MEIDTLRLMDEWGPEKVVCVSDRRTGMRGVLVIDNTARGMGKGGTRMSTSLTVHEVARLARTMTWKWAAVNLYHGGAKAGILSDPRGRDKESILRAFARALAGEVPQEYVFGLDMGLTETDAAIFVDELADRGVAVGLPAALGGLPYDEMGITGFGVAEATESAAETTGSSLVGARVAIQGFGAVGRAAAARLVDLGAVVIGVSTLSGALIDHDGVNVARLVEAAKGVGDDCVVALGGQPDPHRLLELDCDVVIPAARQDMFDKDWAAQTSVRLMAEGANMPTTADALEVLRARGITVVPDFIANAGGIVAAAHSMDARRSPFPVDASTVFAMVSAKMRSNTRIVIEASLNRGITSHQAALDLAQERVLHAMRVRGQVREHSIGVA